MTISVLSTDGVEQPASRDLARFSLASRAERSVALDVAELPLQLVGDSVNTVVVASHIGLDGQRRISVMSPVWIAHRRGFRDAVVRTTDQERTANSELAPDELLTRLQRHDGRMVRDTDRGAEIVDLATIASKRPNGRVTVIESPLAGLTAEDATDMSAGDSPFIEKANVTAKFCVRGGYFYSDGRMGEDFLRGDGSTWFPTYGLEPARYMNFGILKSDNTYLNIADLDTNGCTPSWSIPTGSFTAYLTPWLVRDGKRIYVYPDSNRSSESATSVLSISAGGTINLDFGSITPVMNVGMATSMALHRQKLAFAPSTTYVHVNQPCPQTLFSACYIPSTLIEYPVAERRTVWLGSDHLGNPKAYKKFNFLHELGHASQDQLMALRFPGGYEDAAPLSGCLCDHVQNADSRKHCLQSREHIGAAQEEGFGHFFASDVLNDGAQTNCTFAYYKDVFDDNGNHAPPPAATSCTTQVKWLERFYPQPSGPDLTCLLADRGVEWDWMNFYWSLRNKVSPYTYAQIASVYNQACGTNGCVESEVRFGTLQTAANAVFGPGTAKAAHWANSGDSFGVDH